MDALLCPDGTYVGRTGPNCDFVCPSVGSSTNPGGETSKAVTTLYLDEKGALLGETITPLQILEDSRCPVDVQCVQAGTVKVKVKVENSTGVTVETFTLGTGVITGTEAITLTHVSPQKNSTVQITPGEYRFMFSAIKK